MTNICFRIFRTCLKQLLGEWNSQIDKLNIFRVPTYFSIRLKLRFFQSSYDWSSEQNKKAGLDPDITILSVNHDIIGTWITYLGYLLLAIGLLGTLFNPSSRFIEVRKKSFTTLSGSTSENTFPKTLPKIAPIKSEITIMLTLRFCTIHFFHFKVAQRIFKDRLF